MVCPCSRTISTGDPKNRVPLHAHSPRMQEKGCVPVNAQSLGAHTKQCVHVQAHIQGERKKRRQCSPSVQGRTHNCAYLCTHNFHGRIQKRRQLSSTISGGEGKWCVPVHEQFPGTHTQNCVPLWGPNFQGRNQQSVPVNPQIPGTHAKF
jgi:hypothetical protein